jgi:hypothetical protein
VGQEGEMPKRLKIDMRDEILVADNWNEWYNEIGTSNDLKRNRTCDAPKWT